MLALLATIACKKSEHTPWDECFNLAYPTNEHCPCATVVYDMADYARAYCRPDQTMRVEWPHPIQNRVEDEAGTQALVICECV